MTIHGNTKVLGLIGDPVGHSLSPAIHAIFAKDTGMDAVYVPFPVSADRVEEAVKGAFALGIQGLNVTVPHKQAVIPFLSGIDKAAADTGAVNTLVRTEQGYRGYNTDVTGFLREMRECGADVSGKTAVMLGAGGAANAVLTALLSSGAEHVYILNRSVEKAEKKFGAFPRVTVLPLSGFWKLPEGRHFCVQCTSVGLFPNTEEAVITDPLFYEKVSLAIDLVYRPADTKFMRLVREGGGKAANGLFMLAAQAAESYRLFTGREVPEETLQTAMRAAESAGKV